MQRKISFRGKRTDNGEWVYGFLVPSFRDENGLEIQSRLFDSDGFRGISRHEIDPDTLGEYSGLKDKNGKEIYEGDFVKHGDSIGLVVFDESSCGFYLAKVPNINDQSEWWCLNKHHTKYYEVLGNIHENSGLIGAAPQKEK